MHFLNALERHLSIFWIWISENPHEAAVVAAPIRKLWDWYRCKSRLQKAKAVRKWCVKNCLETGNLSMKEKRGSEGDPCFLIWRYWVSANQGQITGFFVFWCRRKVVTLDFECLKWGILLSMSCKWSTPLWIEICSNSKKCCEEPVVFVISPTRKNAQNAKMNMALSKQQRNAEDEVCCRSFTNCIKIAGVMGIRKSNDGLHFWYPISIFLIIKCCVISWKPPSWKMKLKDDTSVRVDEAASYLRKQLAMNADKCWGDGGKGFTPDPKCMLIKFL